MTRVTGMDRKVFWKWVSVIGLGGLITGWGAVNAIATRWNAIPSLQTSLEESKADRKALREQVSGHEAKQREDLMRIQTSLEWIQKMQAGQDGQLKAIDRKLDRIITAPGRSSVAPSPAPDNPESWMDDL